MYSPDKIADQIITIVAMHCMDDLTTLNAERAKCLIAECLRRNHPQGIHVLEEGGEHPGEKELSTMW